MYLLELNDEGLIDDTPTNTGWKAISVFRKVFKKYGIKGLTCIALSADYQSMFRHYNDEDRPRRASDEIYGDRNHLDFQKDEILKEAIQKYKDLQFNADLEQEKINNEIKLRYLRNLSESNTNGDDVNIAKYNKLLQNHENSIEKFNKRFDRKESLKIAVTNSGYELSRIENDILSRKNSKFVTHGTDISNPDKLGLQKE